MSDLILSPISVRPCIKCGATERSKAGDCKACSRASSAAWRAANPDKRRAQTAAWRAANPDKVKAMKAAWQAANLDKAKARSAAWREANPGAAKARVAAWHAANPDRAKANKAAWSVANSEKKKALDAAWYAANKDMAKAKMAAWREANPEAQRINSQNRRARKRKAGGTLSKDLATKLFKLQKGKCPCCRQPLGDDYHLDHKMPLALGGSNTDDNAQLLRKVCNLQKNAAHPVDFMQSRGFLL